MNSLSQKDLKAAVLAGKNRIKAERTDAIYSARRISVAGKWPPMVGLLPLPCEGIMTRIPSASRVQWLHLWGTYNYYSPHAGAWTVWNEGKIWDCVRSHASIALNLNCEREMKWLFSAAAGGKYPDLSPRCNALPAWQSFYERLGCVCVWGGKEKSQAFGITEGQRRCVSPCDPGGWISAPLSHQPGRNSRIIFHLAFQVVRSESTLSVHTYFKHCWDFFFEKKSHFLRRRLVLFSRNCFSSIYSAPVYPQCFRLFLRLKSFWLLKKNNNNFDPPLGGNPHTSNHHIILTLAEQAS